MKTASSTRTLPPNTLTVEQFTSRAFEMLTALSHGDPAAAMVKRGRGDHQRIDPVDSALADPGRSEKLYAGLGNLAVVVGSVHKKSPEAKIADKLAIQLPRDRMVAALNSDNRSLVAEALPGLVELEDRLAAMRHGKLGHAELLRGIDLINARHMRLAANSFLDRGVTSKGSDVIARAQAAGLVVQSVGLLNEVAAAMATYRSKRREDIPPHERGRQGHFNGHGVELMYFTYKIAQQYKNSEGPTVATRMALTREDSADTQGHTPCPNFDMLVDGVPLQIKYGNAASGDYDPAIVVGHLPSTNLAEDVPVVATWLTTVVSSSASAGQVNAAWSHLGKYFEPIDQALYTADSVA